MRMGKIEYRFHAVDRPIALCREGLKRLQGVLAPYLHRIGNVKVRFTDVNGPKGGQDIACSIHVTLPGHPALRAECLAEGPHEALHGASRRVRTLLDRHLGRSWRAEIVRTPARETFL